MILTILGYKSDKPVQINEDKIAIPDAIPLVSLYEAQDAVQEVRDIFNEEISKLTARLDNLHKYATAQVGGQEFDILLQAGWSIYLEAPSEEPK